ncbi:MULTISPECIES: hypothetical protein [Nocardia]|uniref:hypothetical protein n=1 Tax=Nocardia TaxID=1817 RepID=UPI0002FE5B54|nr:MULTISPECIES: hypothetical protein [Nocardia]
MLESTSNTPTTDPVFRSPLDTMTASEARPHLQFCRGEDDLTAHPGGEADATEVRVWAGELCLAAVTLDAGGWSYAGGDCGHRILEEDMHARFPDWRAALCALTGLALPPE